VRRGARLTLAIWIAALLALSASGCNAILGITEDPIVSIPYGSKSFQKLTPFGRVGLFIEVLA